MSVDWTTIEPATPFSLRRGKFTVPASTLTTEWLGASEVVAQWDFAASKNFIVNTIPAKPTGYVLCIRFRVDDVVYRYRLWDNDNLVLNAEKYNGQIIKKNFSIEVWSVAGSTAFSVAAQDLISGISVIPTDYRDYSNYADATAVEATPVLIGDVVSDYEALPVASPSEHYRPDGMDTLALQSWVSQLAADRMVDFDAATSVDVATHNGAQFKVVNTNLKTGTGSYLAYVNTDHVFVVAKAVGGFALNTTKLFELYDGAATYLNIVKTGAKKFTFTWETVSHELVHTGNDTDYVILEAYKSVNVPALEMTYTFKLLDVRGVELDTYTETVSLGSVTSADCQVNLNGVDLTSLHIAEIIGFADQLSVANRDLMLDYFTRVYGNPRFAIPLVFNTAGGNNT
jgi:hypothetical protein